MSNAWQFVPGYEGFYEVSDRGEVRSYYKIRGHGKIQKAARVLNPISGPYGHRFVCLALRGQRRMRSIARLVLGAFVGPCPQNKESAHLNGNSADDRLINLAWVTHKENMDHKKIHGTILRGENHPMAILRNCDVRRIKKLLKSRRYFQYEIARGFNVDKRIIQKIASGTRWAHIA